MRFYSLPTKNLVLSLCPLPWEEENIFKGDLFFLYKDIFCVYC